MKKALILRGPSGAGKSTFAKEYQANNPDYVIVCRDSFREALIPNHKDTWYKRNDVHKLEKLVSEMVFSTLKNSLFNVIIDETNLNAKYLKKLEMHLIRNNYSIEHEIIGAGLSTEELRRRIIIRDGDIDTGYVDKQYIIFEEILESKNH